MKAAELPLLNLDAATSLYLPLEIKEGRAHHRFALQLPGGEEEWLLGRLCAIEPDVDNDRFNHCVVLRPEKAEVNRIFVAENLWYRLGKRELDAWMTPTAAKNFDWALFERSFNDSKYIRRLSRYWKTQEDGKTFLLRFGADGWGEVGVVKAENNSVQSFGEGFIWSHNYRTPHEIVDLRFLRIQNASFLRKVRGLWKDESSQVRYALRWSQLAINERDSIAFKCENGRWEDLKQIAELVLQVYLDNKKRKNKAQHTWDFVSYGYIQIDENLNPENGEGLFLWRTALTSVFKSANVGGEGVKIGSLPLCLWSYISEHELRDVTVSNPSKQEVFAAKTQLENWTNSHYAPPLAKILMNSFAGCSPDESREFYAALSETDAP